ncbi:MAG: hypothetical protein GX335_10300 [Firmicutes bacterium]|nr:hypothetical protein [Bacillota bacterium]
MAKGILNIELLGSFRITISEKSIPIDAWRSKKALMLLKYLAANSGKKTPGDVLIDLFWPNNDLEGASRSMHTTIYYLRKTLQDYSPDNIDGSTWIRFTNGLYWLNLENGVVLDIKVFRRLVEESVFLEDEEPEKALAASLKALKLYRGHFLLEYPYIDWTVELREHYHEKYIELVLRAGRLLMELKQDFQEAARIARVALGHDPYREALHQLLLRSLIGMGRFPEAVMQYNDFSKALADEFGLEPRAETKNLLNKIRQNSVSPNDAESTEEGCGVLLCDRKAFELILQKRRETKESRPPAMLMSIVLNRTGTYSDVGVVMGKLRRSMRSGDVITRWAKKMAVVLLEDTDELGADVVRRRLSIVFNPQSFTIRQHGLAGGEKVLNRLSGELEMSWASS